MGLKAEADDYQQGSYEMKGNRTLGLDELMIINPGPVDSGSLFLGADGSLYQAQSVGEEGLGDLGEFFLGEDSARGCLRGVHRYASS